VVDGLIGLAVVVLCLALAMGMLWAVVEAQPSDETLKANEDAT
jgi:hypothetical protein